MVINVEIYDNAQLTTKPKPGQILEALPNSPVLATITSPTPITEGHTGFFGYVCGRLNGDVHIEKYRLDRIEEFRNPANKQHFNFFMRKEGATLVERLIPFDEEAGVPIHELSWWNSRLNEDVYLAIGEIVDASDYCVKDELSENLESGSVLLSVESADEVRAALRDFIQERGKKDYVFVAPTGEEYLLDEILLSLREKE